MMVENAKSEFFVKKSMEVDEYVDNMWRIHGVFVK
jgi:hypothetical protein